MSEIYENSEQSKYIYKLNESDQNMFIFEVIVKSTNNKTKIIRKIKKNNKGNLISLDEKIKFNEIKKINLTAIDISFPTNEIVANINFNNSKNFSSFKNENIYLEFISNFEFLECNYLISL